MHSRAVILLFFLVNLANQLAGQEKPVEWYQDQASRAFQTKKVGKAIFFAGMIPAAIGGLVLLDAARNHGYSANQVYGAFALAKIGLLVAGTGLVIWTIEGARYRNYSGKISSLSLSVSPQPESLFSLKCRIP